MCISTVLKSLLACKVGSDIQNVLGIKFEDTKTMIFGITLIETLFNSDTYLFDKNSNDKNIKKIFISTI
jgi:hypothetical protein